ncbi:hypothetical protein CSX00_02550 [Pseudobutyrivibrio ruminis]|uniref:Uncharacterized protein n=1 Tax=Pseudobutyrivibrio ruminis TaxID=46206 RepID=A0A2G3EDK7_9FIRM|nr:hypothetical protein [Pseudobutyrivibrio ruminis]PHU41213.1 hypothetical protein CSX00_02550 [Pseudobutyrivibrio ruminis]
MEKLTKEDLSELTGMTFKIVTVNDSVVRNSDCAFFAALNDEEANAFIEDMKKEIPEGDYNFATRPYDVPNLSYINKMFDNNYRGFEIVNSGLYAPAEELYEKRQDVVNKIASIYNDDGCLYVGLNSQGKAIANPVGDIQVTASFFTNVEDANEIQKTGVAAHSIERWIVNPPADATIFSIDGQVVYGWEIVEATNKVWSQYIVGLDKLKEVVGKKTLSVLVTDDEAQSLIKYEGVPIMFLTASSIKDFVEENKGKIAEKFLLMTVSNAEGVKLVTGRSKYAFLDTDEGRYVCAREDLESTFA